MNKAPSRVRVAVERLPPEGVAVDGEIAFAGLGVADDDRVACPEPLEYALRVAPVQGGILVQGKLRAVLRCVCDRCLTTYDCRLMTDDVCHLFEDTDAKVLDLTDEVREDILLAFPQWCLCHPDCRGLCPTCGRNLNVETCSCASPSNGGDVWSALGGLQVPPETE